MSTKQKDRIDNPTLVAALEYAADDIPIFPCKPNKKPLTPNGFKDATTNEKRVQEWWRLWPDAMIGMPTGPKSGIDVLDLDVKPDEGIDGRDFFPSWQTMSPVIAQTPSGGAHLYFRSAGEVRNSTDLIAPGVDTRGEGGYAIVPPSRSAARRYKFIKCEDAYLQDRNQLPPFPPDLLAKLGLRHTGWSGDAPTADVERIAAAMQVVANPDLGWDEWKRYGMAIFRATGGSAEGFAIFDDWSRKSSKYDADNTEEAWAEITRSPPTRIGAGSIFFAANAADPSWASNGAPVCSTSTPVSSAKEFVRREFERDGEKLLVRYRNSFYRYTGSHYEECDDDFLRAKLYTFLESAVTPAEVGFVPFNPTQAKVNVVWDALESYVYVDANLHAPFWLKGATQTCDPANLIACRNGLLMIDTRQLLPHSPHLFNVNCLPFDYEPEAPNYPPLWMKFLRQLWPNDKLARWTLQEIFGLMLTTDTSFQKIFLLVGPRRSGKGTIGRVLTALLGMDNVAGPTLASLNTNFGLSPLINKRLAIVSDARLGVNTDAQAIAERLLSISGEDTLTIDRKYQEPWTGRLSARFLLLTNELPRITDVSGALASRFILLKLTQSFLDNEDRRLTLKLLRELPGILNWALEGLEWLREYGYFEMPESSSAAIQQLEDLNSPIGAFLRDWCEQTPELTTPVRRLFAAWGLWCWENGYRSGAAHVFGRNLHAAIPGLRTTGKGQTRAYCGVGLSEEGEESFEDARKARAAGKKRADPE